MDGGANHKTMSLQARCFYEADVLAEVVGVLRTCLLRAELPDVALAPQPQRCRLEQDPYDGSSTLVGEWRKLNGKMIGSVVIHENGQLFAELDVLMLLPKDERWLVDAVVVFGTAGELRSELRLTPALT